MSECFIKARELGRLILCSEYAIRLSDAEAALYEAAEGPARETAMRDWREANNALNRFTDQVAAMVKATACGDLEIEQEDKKCGAACGCHKCGG